MSEKWADDHELIGAMVRGVIAREEMEKMVAATAARDIATEVWAAYKLGEMTGPAARGRMMELERAATSMLEAVRPWLLTGPVDALLFCPVCHLQHVDAPEPENGWDNPSHRSHLCAACKTVWRPAAVPTNGVEAVESRGGRDTWPPLDNPAA